MTPTQAIHAGADLLVIGRPITNPPASSGLKGPEQAARVIIKEIETALATR
jgi:orotidine-5'-phosphate decarboxylase